MVTKWQDWVWIAHAIASGAKRQEIADYLVGTICRYCATVNDLDNCHCDRCPLYDAESGDCAGGHFDVVDVWAFSSHPRFTRAEALRSARIIAEITGGD